MAIEVRANFSLIICVVSKSDDVNFICEQFVGDFWGDSDSSSTVFAIYNGEERIKFLAKMREFFKDGVAAGATDDVADEKNLQ